MYPTLELDGSWTEIVSMLSAGVIEETGSLEDDFRTLPGGHPNAVTPGQSKRFRGGRF